MLQTNTTADRVEKELAAQVSIDVQAGKKGIHTNVVATDDLKKTNVQQLAHKKEQGTGQMINTTGQPVVAHEYAENSARHVRAADDATAGATEVKELKQVTTATGTQQLWLILLV